MMNSISNISVKLYRRSIIFSAIVPYSISIEHTTLITPAQNQYTANHSSNLFLNKFFAATSITGIKNEMAANNEMSLYTL